MADKLAWSLQGYSRSHALIARQLCEGPLTWVEYMLEKLRLSANPLVLVSASGINTGFSGD